MKYTVKGRARVKKRNRRRVSSKIRIEMKS
jgi:hypothetical protein